MNVALRRPMSREEFFDWDGHTEGRYEFDGVRPVAMTGGNMAHGIIVSNINREVGVRLKGTPCLAAGPDNGIATTGDRVRYPDVVVTCSPFRPGDKLLSNPIIVFEVVSPGSGQIDRVVKAAEYEAVPSILRYIIVESASVGATVRCRAHGGQAFGVAQLGRGDVLALPEVGVELPLLDVYDRVLP